MIEQQQREKNNEKMTDTPPATIQQPSAPTQNVILDFSQFLAAQIPLPGQPGAPYFNGKEVTKFVRSWERFSERYKIADEKMVNKLVDYCEVNTGEHVATIIDEAKREIQRANLRESWWPKVRAGLLKNSKSDDSEQQRNTVTFLRSLSSDKPFRMKAEEVERYIRTYQQISNTLVSEMRLTAFDQMICFLQGLPDNTATKIFEDMKFDMDEPATFSANGGFSGAVTIALTMTMKKANVSKMQELRILTEERNQTPHTETRILRNPNATKETANQNPQNAQAPQPQAQMQPQTQEKKWSDQMETLKRELEELRLFQQSAMSLGMQRGFQQRNNNSYMRDNQGENRNLPRIESIPVNDRGCRRCGLNNHRKIACYDYNKALREGMVHFIDEADSRTRMGPMGSGGPLVPLPEAAGVWQKVWVANMRQRTESQATVPATDRIVEVNEGTTSEVRNLMLEYTPKQKQETAGDAPVIPAVSQGGPVFIRKKTMHPDDHSTIWMS